MVKLIKCIKFLVLVFFKKDDVRHGTVAKEKRRKRKQE